MGVTAKAVATGTAALIVGVVGWRLLGSDGPDSRSASERDPGAALALASPEGAPEGAPPSALGDPRLEHRSDRLALEAGEDAATADRGALDVRIRWSRGNRPAVGEEVSVFARRAAGDSRRHGFTDGEGRLHIDGLLPGRVLIGSSHGAEGSAEIVASETATAELEIPLGFRVRARVVDPSGAPVPGARLWLSKHYDPWDGYVVERTGPDGEAVLEDVPPERYLGAIADGFAPSHVHDLAYYQAAGESSAVELELELNGAGGSAEVTLHGPHGTPVVDGMIIVKGAHVEPLRLGNRHVLGIPRLTVWSDEDGRASVGGLPPGRAEVAVYSDGMGVWKGSVEIEPGRSSALAVELSGEGVVTGHVFAPDGTPWPGARIWAQGAPRPSATSGEGGQYELRGLPLGDVALRAEADGLGSATTSVRIEPGVPAAWDPRLSPGRVVQGRVVDERGAPLAAWSVEAMVGLQSGWRAQATTDVAGEFRLVDVAREPLVISLYRDRFAELFPTLSRNLSEAEDEVVFRVGSGDRCDAWLRGRFVDSAGEPIGRATVALWARGALSAPTIETDWGGEFRAERLRPGAYDLTADFPAAPTLFLGHVELAPEAGLDLGTIELEPPGTVRITVGGMSPAEREEFDAFAFRQLDEEGRSRWAAFVERRWAGEPVSLHPGRYVLQGNGRLGVANERVALEVRSGEERAVDLEPRRGRKVLVGAELPSEAPIPDFLRTTVRDAGGAVLQECTTCAPIQRRYTHLLQLVPGTYELEAEASDGRRAVGAFDVDLAGAPAPLEFYLPLR